MMGQKWRILLGPFILNIHILLMEHSFAYYSEVIQSEYRKIVYRETAIMKYYLRRLTMSKNIIPVEIYSPVKEEAGVIMVFSKIHEDLGFDKLVTSSARGFDIESINYNGHDVTVEFEYVSSNFIRHDHHIHMIDGRRYVVICWYDDCDLKAKIQKEYNKRIEEVICLEKYARVIVDNKSKEESEEIKYIVLNYNPANADYRSFQEWSNSNLYRCNTRFKDKHIPKGSKVLIKQGDYIVGGFDVVRYEYIYNIFTIYYIILYYMAFFHAE